MSNIREQIEQDKKSNERARFSIQSLETERDNAETILKEITQKLEHLKVEYEEQKRKTSSMQSESDALRQIQR